MLSKLLKYDLKWIYKVVIVFYFLSIFFAILTRIFSLVDNSILFSILTSISMGIMISMIVSCLINTLMRSWARLVRNFYQDEAYLTHTLPVNKKTLYLSKVLASIIVIFTTVLISLISIAVAFYSKDNLNIIKNMLNLAASTYNTTVINLLLLISLVFFLEITFMLLCGYVGIIKGHTSNNNKIFKSVIYGLLFYFLSQLFTLVIIFIIGLFNPIVMNLINTTEIVNFDAIKIVMLAGIFIYIIYNLFYYYIGIHFLNKGINID